MKWMQRQTNEVSSHIEHCVRTVEINRNMPSFTVSSIRCFIPVDSFVAVAPDEFFLSIERFPANLKNRDAVFFTMLCSYGLEVIFNLVEVVQRAICGQL